MDTLDRYQVASTRWAAGKAGGADRDAKAGAGGGAAGDDAGHDDRRHAGLASSSMMLIIIMVPPMIDAGYSVLVS